MLYFIYNCLKAFIIIIFFNGIFAKYNHINNQIDLCSNRCNHLIERLIKKENPKLISRNKELYKICCKFINRHQRDLNNKNYYGEEGEEVTIAPDIRRLFSSEEDFEDMPPNFFYSTGRLYKDFNTRYPILFDNNLNKGKEISLSSSTASTTVGQEAKYNSKFNLIDSKNKNIIEEYEEEWVYEDENESNSSEFIEEKNDNNNFEEDLNDFTTPTSDISSSVEALIEKIEDSRDENHSNEVKNKQQFFTKGDYFINDKNSEEGHKPMLQNTNIYFAKILEFDQDPESEGQTTWPYDISSLERTIAQFKFNPEDTSDNQQETINQKQNYYNGNSPFEILPADINEYYTNELSKNQKNIETMPTKHRFNNPGINKFMSNDRRHKIFVSTEPVPTKKSETFIVLLGVYLSFFALASLFLFCLVLAWLERRSRRHNNNLNDYEIKESKSLFLYMNPQKGTMKYIA